MCEETHSNGLQPTSDGLQPTSFFLGGSARCSKEVHARSSALKQLVDRCLAEVVEMASVLPGAKGIATNSSCHYFTRNKSY